MECVNDTIYDLIINDTAILSPETDNYTEPIHTAMSNPKYSSGHVASEKCGMITRYYEDDRFAIAYGLRAYEGGVAIIYDKFWNKYYTVILGEDDGAWFPRESWTFTRKSDYIACMSEALSIFNSNFNYD